jgi:hypothetical protein
MYSFRVMDRDVKMSEQSHQLAYILQTVGS